MEKQSIKNYFNLFIVILKSYSQIVVIYLAESELSNYYWLVYHFRLIQSCQNQKKAKWLIHVNVWQKLLQYYKVIRLQLK